MAVKSLLATIYQWVSYLSVNDLWARLTSPYKVVRACVVNSPTCCQAPLAKSWCLTIPNSESVWDFVSVLEKRPQKHMQCFKRPLRRKHWAVHKFSSGLRYSKEEKWALKIILILGARQQVVRTSMSKKFEKNQRGSSVHNWRNLRSYRCELEFLSADFDIGFEHETRCREVCSPPAHKGPKKTLVWLCARSWKIRVKVTQTFFLRSSRATKVGAMCTIFRPNKLRANGRRPLHRDRKKQDKWGQMWKRCSLFFSMFVESCTGNSFLMDRLSIRNFTWRFWGDWERMCEENAQNCGDRVIGFSIMTTPQLTQLCLWSGIWPVWDGPSFPTHPIHRT